MMGLEDHARLLVTELLKLGKSDIIDKELDWAALTKGARYCEPAHDSYFLGKFMDDSNTIKAYMKEHLIKASANYLFVDIQQTERYRNVGGTPYRVIGPHEERVLREAFYKDVPFEVRDALTALGIPHFIELYELYAQKSDKPFTERLTEAVAEAASILLRDSPALSAYYHSDSLRLGELAFVLHNCNGNSEIPKGQGFFFQVAASQNCWLHGWKMESLFANKPSRAITEYHSLTESVRLSQMPEFTFAEDFPEFVFTLPEEDRNPDADREILNIDSLPLERVMLRTYREHPELFLGYFEALDEEKRLRVAREVSLLTDGKKDNLDVALFLMGYESVRPEAEMLLSNADALVRYVKVMNAEEQEALMRMLYQKKDLSSEVMQRLSDEFPELVERVGMYHVREGGE